MLAVLLALAVLLGGPGPATGHARLTVTQTAPFVVRGTGFKPAERVTLTLAAGNRLTRVVVANAAGTFRRMVTRLEYKDVGCPQFVVTARGSRGSWAVLKVIQGCANIGPVDG